MIFNALLGTEMKYKDYLVLTISIVAFLMSGYTFIDNNFLNQHRLKASVIDLDSSPDSLIYNILIVNTGKSYETLYSGKFIYSKNLNTEGGILGNENIGPIIVPPKQAVIAKLKMAMPNTEDLQNEGITNDNFTYIHVGVLFDVVDKQGNLPEGSKTYKFTRLKFNTKGEFVGAKSMKGDHEGMIDLL